MLQSPSGDLANAFFMPGIAYSGFPAEFPTDDTPAVAVSKRIFRDGTEEVINTDAHSYELRVPDSERGENQDRCRRNADRTDGGENRRGSRFGDSRGRERQSHAHCGDDGTGSVCHADKRVYRWGWQASGDGGSGECEWGYVPGWDDEPFGRGACYVSASSDCLILSESGLSGRIVRISRKSGLLFAKAEQKVTFLLLFTTKTPLFRGFTGFLDFQDKKKRGFLNDMNADHSLITHQIEGLASKMDLKLENILEKIEHIASKQEESTKRINKREIEIESLQAEHQVLIREHHELKAEVGQIKSMIGTLKWVSGTLISLLAVLVAYIGIRG